MLDFFKPPTAALETILNSWEKGVECLTIALTAGVLLKLWANGLVKIYPLLFSYLAIDFISAIVSLAIPFNTTAYGIFYVLAQIVKIAIAAFMLAEIYWLALERHPALARFGKNAVGYILAAAAMIPAIAVWVDRSLLGYRRPYLRAFLLSEQTVNGTIAIFLILISLFITWFPIRLRHNVIVYVWGFIAWSLTHSAAVHLVNQFHGNQPAIDRINIAEEVLLLGCLLYWLVGLRREGEGRTAVVGHLWNRAEAQRLTEQLDAINNSLARLRRR